MKDLTNERLMCLAATQESLFCMGDKMERWQSSQLILEKNSYDVMNISDKILNLSAAGNKLVEGLQEYYLTKIPAEEEEIKPVTEILYELQKTFDQILEHSQCANETAHILEKETAEQMELVDCMQGLVCRVMDQIDSVVACEEFLLAEL